MNSTKIKKLIGDAKIKEAINGIEYILDNTLQDNNDLYELLIHVKSTHTKLQKDIFKDIISESSKNQTENKLNSQLFYLLEKIDEANKNFDYFIEQSNNANSQNHTDVDTWTVEDLVNALGENDPKKRKIRVPKFQRNLVWMDDQKMKFIESVKRGFPIGSLLLHKTGSEDGYTVYQLIDGLQRSTTLLKYRQNPTNFFDNSEIHDEIVNEISKHKTDLFDDTLREYIGNWVRQLKGFEETDDFSSQHLIEYIEEKLNLNIHKEQSRELRNKFIQPFTQKIKKDADIFNFRIPIVIYSGNQNNLAEIFSRLNKEGTHLSKYQIYAATWISYSSFKIMNKELIDKIKKKYEKLIEEELQIENYDPNNFENGEFTVFEYFFGLGKLLIDKFPNLFNDRKGEEESIGFNLGATCLGLGIKSLDSLPKYFLRVDQKKFEEALFDAIKIINEFLNPYISLKASKKKSNNKPTIYHTEYQIVSLIGKVFRSKYEDTTLNVRSEWKSKQKQLNQNIPMWYLYDILRGKWRGAPDDVLKFTKNDRYESQISRNSWESELDEWFNAEILRQEKIRANISDSTILFLKYIYKNLINDEYQTEDEFDIEPIISIEKLKKLAKDNKGLPMGAFANICFIEKSMNKEKGNISIHEFLMENRSNKKNYKEIERLSFTSKEDLQLFSSSKLTLETYINFLKQRYVKLRKLFIDKNGIL